MTLSAETERDLATLAAIGPVIEDQEYHRATPCVRLTFVSDGNLSDRSARLDAWRDALSASIPEEPKDE